MADSAQDQPHDQDISLSQLLTRALLSSDKITSAPSPNLPPIQLLLTQTLSDLTLASKLIAYLGVLSPNETLDDIATRDLRCLLVDALRGQLAVLAKTKGGEERLQWLKKAQEYFTAYLKSVEQYEIIPPSQRLILAGPKTGETDPGRRRAGKIAQFKMEREIKGTLEELRQRRRKSHIRSTVPSTSSSSSSPSTSSTPSPLDDPSSLDFLSDDDDDEASDIARPLLLSLLTFHYLRAHAELGSIEQEMEILEHGMKMSDLPPRGEGRMLEFMRPGSGREDAREEDREGLREGEEDDATWRLDKLSLSNSAPVLSPEGKVLRPFVILPSSSSNNPGGMSTRLRLQQQVFQPGHRLPTMTIDDFLDREMEMGNVLQGGGPSNTAEVEEAEREERALREEDNRQGYEDEEGGLRKKREWDDWTDTHRKGEGNMHNRG